ncbi:Por secretion system C-terminal sorting domain-containing protein [Apibacter mensalis]|uniref:Por secretion system C-terminal sorting domain-containing protein n=2 Tax=Apibacter mensalis TaxID=1586267 RepID=A0A0X8XY29_9FLAO|nr:Por secretion system C-terminal sorting domain-containing protein [Apibacter mensalis]
MKKFLFFITLLFTINLVTAKNLPANFLMKFYLQEQPYTKSKLYPNPAVNFILVKNSSSYTINNISVLSMVGTNLINKDITGSNLNHEINISKLPTGRYFVKVTYSDGSREILTLIKL